MTTAPPLPQDWGGLWIVVCGALAAFFFAWCIGANDIANAFATSVGAKTLKLWQAMLLGAVCELTGALVLGRETTKTIANDIANVSNFEDAPEIYMYGMLCALTVAGFWVLYATRQRLPVSTTHSIVGAIMGFALVFGGWDGVIWYEKTGTFPYCRGFVPLVLSWFFSPLIGGLLGAAIYSLNRLFILRRLNSTKLAIACLPLLLFITTFINVMFLLAKGANKEMQDLWPCTTVIGMYGLPYQDCSSLNKAAAWIAAAVAGGVAVFGGAASLFFLRRRYLAAGSHGTDTGSFPKLRVGLASDPFHLKNVERPPAAFGDPQRPDGSDNGASTATGSGRYLAEPAQPDLQYPKIPDILPNSLQNVGLLMWAEIQWPFVAFYVQWKRGLFYDVFAQEDSHVEKVSIMNANVELFAPRTESVYEILLVFTACCVAFVHGSTDIANAAGPFSAIYYTYQRHTVPGGTANAPEWIFVVTGFGLVLGLLMYGYNVILELGVNLIRLTPSRGFSAELAASLTIVVASFWGIPVSTTQIIVGCEVGVGLCEGIAGVSWFTFLRAFVGWVLTIWLALAFCACLFSLGAYAPSILMWNDIQEYRSMLQNAANQTLTTLSTVNEAYINDTWWNQSMMATGMPYNGSQLAAHILSQLAQLAKNERSGGFMSPQQVMYYYTHALTLSNQYMMNVVGQNATAIRTSSLWHIPPPA